MSYLACLAPVMWTVGWFTGAMSPSPALGQTLRALPPDARVVDEVGTRPVRDFSGVIIPVPVDPIGGVLDRNVFCSPAMEPTMGPVPIVDQVDFMNRGMSSDNAGTFYVATGSVGTRLCGVGGSGARLFLSAGFDAARCLTLEAGVAESRHVTVSPGIARAYTTFACGRVIFFPSQ